MVNLLSVSDSVDCGLYPPPHQIPTPKVPIQSTRTGPAPGRPVPLWHAFGRPSPVVRWNVSLRPDAGTFNMLDAA